MANKKTPALAGAKGRKVDLSVPNLSTADLWDSHREHLERELGSKDAVDVAYGFGARSITLEQAQAARFGIKGPNGDKHSSSGMLFPFADGFAHLRCDKQPRNRQGDHCKYLTPVGSGFALKVFGDGDPTIATEGWKDALRIHLETGEATVALPSVSAYKIIPDSIEKIVYDADAAHNPYVWGLLVRAGIRNRKARIGFFPREVAGDKGGACEYFSNGGDWSQVTFVKPRALVCEIYKGWSPDLRADFIPRNLRVLIRCLNELDFDPLDSEILLKQASRQVKATKDMVAALQHRYANSLKSDDAEPDEPEDTYSRALAIEAAIGDEWRAEPKSKEIYWHYDGTRWQQLHGNDYPERALEAFYDLKGWRMREKHVVASDLAIFRRRIKGGVPASATGLVPFANGILRLADMTLHPHSPDFGNTYCLPYPWLGVDAKCEKFDAFLQDRLGSSGTLDLYYAACNIALTGNRFKGFIEITGDKDVGKSVVVAGIEALVGDENRESGRLAVLEHPMSRFESIRFLGKRLAVFPESGTYSGPLEQIKRMTGRDTISGEIKGVRNFINFVFDGLVVITGNKPIRFSDSSGAIYTRRRSIHITGAIPDSQQREMLEFKNGKWVGELANELSGFAAKVLTLSPDVVRQALRRNTHNLKRVTSELQALFQGDHLARWANEHLVWDERIPYSRIGMADANPADRWLLAHYRAKVTSTENFKPYGQNVFKERLLSLLRAYDVPLPPEGDPAFYIRNIGSVIPHIRLRVDADGDAKGIIEWAALRRAGQLTEQGGDAASPVGDGCDERDGKNENPLNAEMHPPKPQQQKSSGIVPPVRNKRARKSVTSITSITNSAFKGTPDVQGSFPIGSGADVDDGDGDDPHWPKRGKG